MSRENISIDYGKVDQIMGEIRTGCKDGFEEIGEGYGKLSENMTKSAGEMLEATILQEKAEQELINAMSNVCVKLADSISTAAQSFKNIDNVMVGYMN